MREIRRKLGLCLIVIFLLEITFSGCKRDEESNLQEITAQENLTESEYTKETGNTKSTEDTDVWIYVCGAVNAPGVYTFDGEVRMFEVIEKAGGMTDVAALNYLNQAQIVADGEQIYVPTQEEVDSGIITSNSSERESQNSAIDSGKININTATKEELMTLSGVGEIKANSIISYRESHGGFQSVEEIMQVEGIKEGVFQKMKDSITV